MKYYSFLTSNPTQSIKVQSSSTTCKMPRIFQATYNSYYTFRIPKSVFLLSEDDNKKKENFMATGSWWVKWATLSYIDENGEEQNIEGDDNSEHKWPDSVCEIDTETDDDEESVNTTSENKCAFCSNVDEEGERFSYCDTNEGW